MDNTEITDVRVVETVPNYAQAIKLAAVATVVTVLLTATTQTLLESMTARAKRRQTANNSKATITEI